MDEARLEATDEELELLEPLRVEASDAALVNPEQVDVPEKQLESFDGALLRVELPGSDLTGTGSNLPPHTFRNGMDSGR